MKSTLLIAGCFAAVCMTSSAPAAEKTYVFGFIPKQNYNPIFLMAKAGAEAEAATLSKENGVDIKIEWRGPEQDDPQQQANIIEQLTNSGISGIAISCTDANKVTDAINTAVNRGVPVVTFDSDAPNSKRFATFGTDDIDCGHKVMAQLATELNGKGVVAILAGNPNAPNLQKRVQGAKEEAKKYPAIQILDTFYHKETPEDSAAKVEDVTLHHPEINGWLFIGGWPLLTENAIKWSPGTIKVASVDALPGMLSYLRSGHVQILLAQQVYEWGTESVKLLFDKVSANKQPKEAFVKADLIPVTKANADEYLKTWQARAATTAQH